MGYRLGVDTGGSFTDFTLVDDQTGQTHLHKLPSTPDDPSRAVLQGITELVDGGIDPRSVDYLGHGTTVAINAVLTRRFAKTALLTTAGFRDLLDLARQRRPHVWDLDVQKPTPIVPRSLRWEVDERLAADGSVVKALDLDEVERIVEEMNDRSIEAVAVAFLHSYANPAHEAAVRDLLVRINPSWAVSLSSEVLPEFREFERTSTTAINAALQPVMAGYLRRLQAGTSEIGLPGAPRIMQSNGGITGAVAAVERPIDLLFSGPSAGVTAAAHVAWLTGFTDVIAFDVGGTSTDVCLIEGGTAVVATEQTVAGFPVKTSAAAVHSVGAGGGSIGWIDAGGFLRVGPRSAGAVPGPACYELGGTEPTVTDACVVLGRLNPLELLGGRMKISQSAAQAAVKTHIGGPLNLSVEEAARGMLDVLISNVVRAVRVISVERGRDPRDFTLVAYGGAGPMHATFLARELGIRRVIVPAAPGVMCATGLLVADLRRDYAQTLLTPCEQPDVAAVSQAFASMESAGRAWLRVEGVVDSGHQLSRSADVRYMGQEHAVRVPVPSGELYADQLRAIADSFHIEHERVHGYSTPNSAVEIVAVRLVASSPSGANAFPESHASGTARSGAARRTVDFGSFGVAETPVYQREDVVTGQRIAGPAVIEQMDTTTVILPDQCAVADDYGNLVVEEEQHDGE